jgi:SAM-dependent methyltransferase
MSDALWADIAERMRSHGYMKGVERAVERVRKNGEIFTPSDLVVEMLRGLPLETFEPGRTVLDPACGDGQFLVAAKWIKVLHHGMSEASALDDIYGIDIMRDNVDVCVRRLGGGTIVVGDALNPARVIPGQSPADIATMARLFGAAPALNPQLTLDLRELAVS